MFERLIGQEHAARALTAAFTGGHPSHAYLLAGPPGSGKLAAAQELAAALCCTANGCGDCPSCTKALSGAHPDIVRVAPVGQQISIDQIREVNRSLALRPFESRARVFIIEAAATMGAEAANAFLKSLEEPPVFVYFLLLAARFDLVLPTIVSRCQVVRFRAIPPQLIEDLLQEQEQLSPVLARAYARVSGGNLALARSFSHDPKLCGRREHYLRIAADLCRGDWEGSAAELLAQIESASEEAASGASEQPPTGFGESNKQRLEKDAHRRAGAAKRRELELALDCFSSWFRDMMVSAAGVSEVVLNEDYRLELDDRALPSKLEHYREALAVVEATRKKLGYNIDLGLALQAMFYQLQEVL